MSYLYDIYISYAPQDKAIAIQICTLLEAKGYPCYIEDRDGLLLKPRDNRNRPFHERVFGGHNAEDSAASAGIRSSKMYLQLVSPASMKSSRVRTELFLANDQVSRGIIFLAVFIDDAMTEEQLGADFQFVIKDGKKIRWSGRRSAHTLATAVQEIMEPSGIRGITMDIEDEEEVSSVVLDEKMSMADFTQYLEEQIAQDIDNVTADAKTQYAAVKAVVESDPSWALAGFERVTLVLDGEWKADNVELRRMLVDCYIQMARLRDSEQDARKAVNRADSMATEVAGPADFDHLATAITVLADILTKDRSDDHRKEIRDLYIHAAEVYENMVRKEASKVNLIRLMKGYWTVLDWADGMEESKKSFFHKRLLETTDAIYDVVCGQDKMDYEDLEVSYLKLEEYYRPKAKNLADKCLVRARIMHLP